MTQAPTLTPMMAQWKELKEKARSAILLFRMGDFYEIFYKDAEIAASILDLTLTKRGLVPMCGVPWHTLDVYLDRLTQRGLCVAIAEQVQDPKDAKGLVKRDIVRFVTPGTTISDQIVSEKSNNYIAALSRVGAIYGLSLLDLGTGEFKVTEHEEQKELINEIFRLQPKEIVMSKQFHEKAVGLCQELFEGSKPTFSIIDNWHFDHKSAYAILVHHFQVIHLDSFGLKGMVAAINAAGGLLAYIQDHLSLPTSHIKTLTPFTNTSVLTIDRTTARHLELLEPLHQGGASLLSLIDRTRTPMGGRALRSWLSRPLLSLEEINHRQDAIENLHYSLQQFSELASSLQKIRDLQRLMMKVMANWATPRDLIALKNSLQEIPSVKNIIASLDAPILKKSGNQLKDMSELTSYLSRALVDEPPLRIGEGVVFREGFDPRLDEIASLVNNDERFLTNYQNQLREETQLKTLKISYNKIFGYYIEVSKKQAESLPATFIKKQTLVNSERFITPELKEHEHKLLSAQEKRLDLEKELYSQLRDQVASHFDEIMECASGIATLDALVSLAEVARKFDYTRPVVDKSGKIEIVGGRHPVVETKLAKMSFIPNDTVLNNASSQLAIITGPNMAGKSTYIRQVALLVILAQMGSYIPASKAQIGVIDKIFTRIGASDDLTRGQSTFMVEMAETANILNNATSSSLVILDEIGRGTSTYDGLSIAWAVAEYFLTQEGRKAKTLFATHYFELTTLEDSHPGAVNYYAAIDESNDEIHFLYKMLKGRAGRSYGIHVAKLAGIPSSVITRATEILDILEKREKKKSKKESFAKELQLSLFNEPTI